MKNINFINPLSPQKYQACSKWFRVSTFLMAITLLIVTIISIQQLHTIKETNNEIYKKSQSIKDLERIVEEKKKLSEQEKELTEQSEIIKNIQASSNKKFTLISEINKRMPKKGILKTISLNKHDFNLLILCDNTKQVEYFIKNIAALPEVENARLASMQSHEQQLMCTIKGKMK